MRNQIGKESGIFREATAMPKWLRRQLMRAFYGKDRWQIRYLNECWFTFCKKDRTSLGG